MKSKPYIPVPVVKKLSSGKQLDKYSSIKESNFTGRSNTKNLSIINNSKLRRKALTIPIKECPVCNIDISVDDLFNHLETECLKFKCKAQQQEISKYNQQQLSKVILNSKQTPFTERPDNGFIAKEIQKSQNIELSHNAKEYRLNSKFKVLHQIEVPYISMGKVPIKSNLFCVFGLYYKDRYIKYHIAYRAFINKEHTIEIIDLSDNTVCSSLKGHTDHITEIKYYYTKSGCNYLISCSYDGLVNLWDVSNFKLVRKINFGCWAFSSAYTGNVINSYSSKVLPIVTTDNKDVITNNNNGNKYSLINTNSTASITISSNNFSNDLLFVAGRFFKHSSVKAYDIESSEFIFEITFEEENITPILLEIYNKKHKSRSMNLLVVGTDKENPQVIVIDYLERKIIYTLKMKSAVSSITFFYNNIKLFIYITDISGNVVELDGIKFNNSLNFSSSNKIFDLLNYDNFHLFGVGDKNGNIVAFLRHKHSVAKTFKNVHDKAILNIQKFSIKGYGNCIFTLGTDKIIKISKL